MGSAEEALARVQTMTDDDALARAAAGLGPMLPPGRLRSELLVAARAIQQPLYRARALVALAASDAQPSGEGPEIIREVQEAVSAIRPPYLAIKNPVVSLAPEMAQLGLDREALALARSLPEPVDRLLAMLRLVRLLPHGTGDQIVHEVVDELWAAARSVEKEYRRSRAIPFGPSYTIEVLVPELASLGRVNEACRLALASRHGRAVGAVAAYLPEAAVRNTLPAVTRMEDEGDWIPALGGLAARLAELGFPRDAFILVQQFAKDRAFALTREVAKSVGERVSVLGAIAPHLPESLLPEALALARKVGDRWPQVSAMTALSRFSGQPHLGPESRTRAQDLYPGRRQNYDWVRDSRFLRAAKTLSASGHPSLALRMIWATSRGLQRQIALQRLVPHLPSKQVSEALALVWTTRDELIGLLIDLAPYLSESEVRNVLGALENDERFDLFKDSVKAHLLGRLADLGYAEEAITKAKEIEFEVDWATALASIIPHLPEALVRGALEAANVLSKTSYREEVGAALALRLGELGQLRDAVLIACAIDSDSDRPRVWDGLAAKLLTLSPPEQYGLLSDTLRASSRRARSSLLGDLVCFAPLLASVGGQAAAQETASAIADVARWWP